MRNTLAYKYKTTQSLSHHTYPDEINWHEDYRETCNIRCTFVDNKLADHSDVVGAAPTPTSSSLLTYHLASMIWAKTTAKRDENIRFVIRAANQYSHCDVGNWNRYVLKAVSAEANFIVLSHSCSAHSKIAALLRWMGLLLSIRIKHVQAIPNCKRCQ